MGKGGNFTFFSVSLGIFGFFSGGGGGGGYLDFYIAYMFIE